MSLDTYHHGDLRRALLEAALEVLETEGPAKLSLREVARRSGVSQAAPYSHFADKRALLAAVATGGFRELEVALTREAAGIGDPAQRMQALGVGYVEFATARPALFRLMFGTEISGSEDAELLAAAGTAYQMIRTATHDTLSADAAKRDPDLATLAAWSVVHGLASLMVDGKVTPELVGAPATRDLTLGVTTLLLDGVRGRGHALR